MAKSQMSLKVNGKPVDALVEPRTLLIHFLREQLSLTGPHIGCETSHCGACTVDLDGKSVKSCTVFAVQAERRRHPHHRGHGQRRRHAACAAGRLPRDARAAMRLLHAGHDHARLPAAAGEPEPDAKRKSASASPATSAAAPATRTSSRPFSTPPPSSTACRSRRPQNERHDPHLRRARREAARHGLQAQARRGHPLHPGQGQLRRRPEAARHALRRLRPLAATPTRASRTSTPRKAAAVPGRASRCSPPTT